MATKFQKHARCYHCERSACSLEEEAACLAASSSDGEPLQLWSGPQPASDSSAPAAATWPTPAAMDGWAGKLAGSHSPSLAAAIEQPHRWPKPSASPSTETCSTTTQTEDPATSSPEGSLASRSAMRVDAVVKMTRATCGHTPFAYWSKVTVDSRCLRTSPVFSAPSAICALLVAQAPSQLSLMDLLDAGAAMNTQDSSEWPGVTLAKHLWMTPQLSLTTTSEPYSETWPTRGSMRNGQCYQQQISVPLISGDACGSWPTPQTGESDTSETRDWNENGTVLTPGGYTYGMNLGTAVGMTEKKLWPTAKANNGNGPAIHGTGGLDLQTAVVLGGATPPTFPEAEQLWGTPTSRDWKDGGRNQNVPENGLLSRQVPNREDPATPGSLNPEWVEWLMMFPRGWTDSRCLGTLKSLEPWRQRGVTWLRQLGYLGGSHESP